MANNVNHESKPQWVSNSNILVVVRCRPLSENERKAREEAVVRVIDGKTIIIKDPGHTAENEMRKKRLRDRPYAFDHSFDPTTRTEIVYQHTTKFLVDGVVAGQNATVFAYGATGSGKTHTMLGSRSTPGLMVLTLQDLYQTIEKVRTTTGRTFRVSLSYVEVYNENIRDLLATNSSSDDYLDIREDPIKGNCVAGVSEHNVSSTDDILDLLTEGNRKRTQESTAANKESSRSHAVLQIHVHSRDPAKPRAAAKVGKFSLIDLAGSERAVNTKNSGIRLIEGANINRSLLALGNCITALVQGKGSFVPYRDSKLTRLLKDSLGGNCKTVMISCISPAGASFEETCNTLKYANRAKNIKTNLKRAPEVSVQAAAAQAVEYEHLISGLRSEVATLKHKLAATAVLSDGSSNNSLSPGGLLRRTSLFMNAIGNGQPVLSAAALSSPALKRTGMGRAISPIHSPVDGIDRFGGDAVGFVPNKGGIDASSSEREGKAGTPRSRSAPLVIPEGYVLINAVEAQAAMERLRVLREALVSNFQERMQLRRSLIELQTQNAANQAEIGRRQMDIARWEQGQHEMEAAANHNGGPVPMSPFSPSGKTMVATQAAAAAARREIMELQSAISHNTKMKEHMVARLEAATKESDGIRSQLDEQCNNDERRELLSLEYRVYLLELEKIELEQSSLLASRELQAQNIEIRKLRLALKARDRLLKTQYLLLQKAGLLNPAIKGVISGVAAMDAELSGPNGGGLDTNSTMDNNDDDDDEESTMLDNESMSMNILNGLPILAGLEDANNVSLGNNHPHNNEDNNSTNPNDVSLYDNDMVSSMRQLSFNHPHDQYIINTSQPTSRDISTVDDSSNDWNSNNNNPTKGNTNILTPPKVGTISSSNTNTTAASPRHTKSTVPPPVPVVTIPTTLSADESAVISPSRASSWMERAVELVRKGMGKGNKRDSSQPRTSTTLSTNNNDVSKSVSGVSSSAASLPVSSIPSNESLPINPSSYQPLRPVKVPSKPPGITNSVPVPVVNPYPSLGVSSKFDPISTMEIHAALGNNVYSNGGRNSGLSNILESDDNNDDITDENRHHNNNNKGDMRYFSQPQPYPSSITGNNHNNGRLSSPLPVSKSIPTNNRASIGSVPISNMNSNNGINVGRTNSNGSNINNNNGNGVVLLQKLNHKSQGGNIASSNGHQRANSNNSDSKEYDFVDQHYMNQSVTDDTPNDNEEDNGGTNNPYGPSRPSIGIRNRPARKGAVWQNSVQNKPVIVKGVEKAQIALSTNNNDQDILPYSGFSAARAATDLSHAFSAYGGNVGPQKGSSSNSNNNNNNGKKLIAPLPQSIQNNNPYPSKNRHVSSSSSSNNNNYGGGGDNDSWDSNILHTSSVESTTSHNNNDISLATYDFALQPRKPKQSLGNNNIPSQPINNNGRGAAPVRGGRVIRAPDERPIPTQAQGHYQY